MSMHGLKHLRVLDLTKCTMLTDQGIGYVPYDGLKQLYLDGIDNFTDNGATTLADMCHNLMVLHVVGCYRLTNVAAIYLFKECKKLKELNVFGCPNIKPAVLASLSDSRTRTQSVGRVEVPIDFGIPKQKDHTDLSRNVHKNGSIACDSFLPRLPSAVLRQKSATEAAAKAHAFETENVGAGNSSNGFCGNQISSTSDLGDFHDGMSGGGGGCGAGAGNDEPGGYANFLDIINGDSNGGARHKKPHLRRFGDPTSKIYRFRGIRPVVNAIGLVKQDQKRDEIHRQAKAVCRIQGVIRAFFAHLKFRKLVKGARKKQWEAARIVQARWRGRGTRTLFDIWRQHKQTCANKIQNCVLRRLTRRRCWLLKRFAVKWWRMEARELNRNAIQLRYIMRGWFAFAHMRFTLERNLKKTGIVALTENIKNVQLNRKQAAYAFMGAVETSTFNSNSSTRWLRAGDRFYATCVKRRLMNGWWLGVMQARLLKTKAKSFYLKIFASGAKLVLLRWRCYAELRLQQKGRYRNADKMARRRRISRGIRLWLAFTKEKAAKGRQLRKALLFMTNGVYARCWLHWTEMVKERKAMRRAAKHLLNRRQSAVWNRWCQFVCEVKDDRAKLAKALQWMINGTQMKFFQLWKAWLAYRRDLCRRTIMRMVFKYIAASFFQWKEWLEEYNYRMRMAARVQAIWRGRMARDGFDDFKMDINWATTKIQTMYRGRLGKKYAWKQARMNRIKEYMNINEPEIKRMEEEDRLSVLFRAKEKVAFALQRKFRGEKGRGLFLLRKRIFEREQRFKEAVMKQQRIDEAVQRQLEREKEHERQSKAATLVQGAWKRKVANRYLNMLRRKAREKGALMRVQRYYRMRLARRALAVRKRLLDQQRRMRERRRETGYVYRFFGFKNRKSQRKALQFLEYWGMWPDSYCFVKKQHKQEVYDDALRFMHHMHQVHLDVKDLMRQKLWAWRYGVPTVEADVLLPRPRSQYPEILPGQAVRIIDRTNRLCGEQGYVLNITKRGEVGGSRANVRLDKDGRIIFLPLQYDFTKTISNVEALVQVPSLEIPTIPYEKARNSQAALFALAENWRIKLKENKANTTLSKVIRGRAGRKRFRKLYAEWMIEIEERREEIFRLLSSLGLANMTVGRALVKLKIIRERELPPQLKELDIMARLMGGGQDFVAALYAHRAIQAELSAIRTQNSLKYKRDFQRSKKSGEYDVEDDDRLPWRNRGSLNQKYHSSRMWIRQSVSWKLASKIKYRAGLIDLYDEIPEGGSHTRTFERLQVSLAKWLAGRSFYWGDDQMNGWVGTYRLSQFANSPHVAHHPSYPDAAGQVVFHGSWKDGVPHGPGTAWFPMGIGRGFDNETASSVDDPRRWIKYQEIEGTFENGKIPIGSHVEIILRNRSVYEGPFVEYGQDPKPSHWGKLTLRYGSAERYADKNILEWEGRVVDNHFNENCVCGWIKATWTSRPDRKGRKSASSKDDWMVEVYEGFYENSQRHGYGINKYKNGAEYAGEWRAGKRHGHGAFTNKKGDVYVGEWFNDKKHGWGVETMADTKSQEEEKVNAESDLSEGKAEEQGEALDTNVANVEVAEYKYEGFFCHGKREGKGKLIFRNRDRYQGDFQGGMRHGSAVVFYTNGDRYEGPYVRNKRHGNGILNFKNAGERYEGPFVDNEMHGRGVYVKTRSSGYHQKRKGVWVRGNHVRWTGWCVSKFATDAFLSQFGVPCEDDPKPYKDPDWVKRNAEKRAKEAAEKEKKRQEEEEEAARKKRQEAKAEKVAARRKKEAKEGKGGAKGIGGAKGKRAEELARKKEEEAKAEADRLRKEEIARRKKAREAPEDSEVDEDWEPPGGWDETTFDGVYASMVAEKLPALPDGVDPENFVVCRVVDRIMGAIGPTAGDQMLKRAKEALAELAPKLKIQKLKTKRKLINVEEFREEVDEQVEIRDEQKETLEQVTEEFDEIEARIEAFWEEDVHNVRKKYQKALKPLFAVKPRDWHTLKSMKERPKEIEQVMMSACLLLGMDPRWRQVEELCNGSAANQTRGVADSFINDYDCKLCWMLESGLWDPYSLAGNVELFNKVSKFFYDPTLKANNPDIFEVSMPTSRVCLWFRRAFLYARKAKEILNDERERKRLKKQVDVETETLEDEEEILMEMNEEMAQLQKEHKDMKLELEESETLERRLLRTIKKIEDRMTELQVLEAESKLNAKGGIRESLEAGEITEQDILAYLRDENFVMLGALVQAGMDKDWRDSYGNTLLIIAAQHTQHEAVVYLIEKLDVNVNLQNANGNTALHYSIAYDPGGETVPFLMDAGADDQITNRFGLDPYSGLTYEDTIEFQDQSEDAIMQLLAKCAAAIQSGDLAVLQKDFLDEKYDPNQPDRDGNTLLHFVAMSDLHEDTLLEVAQLLIDAGATAEHQNYDDKNSALHIALGRFPSSELGPLLIEAGADDTALNKWGQTPYEGYCDQSWRGICSHKEKDVLWWEPSEKLFASMQLNEERVMAAKPKESLIPNVTDNAWTTVVVLRGLELKCTADEDLWGNIYKDSKKWLRKCCKHQEFSILWEAAGRFFGEIES
eukprot:g4439.t1